MKTIKLPCRCSANKPTVHNLTRVGEKFGMSVWRCTVCLDEKTKGTWGGM